MTSKTKKYVLPGEFRYDFRPPNLCAHCDLPISKHVEAGGACLFEATHFIPDALTSFLHRFLFEGGELIFRVGEETLSVPLKLTSLDHSFDQLEQRNTLRCLANGNAVLETVPDAENRQKLLDHARRRRKEDPGEDGAAE